MEKKITSWNQKIIIWNETKNINKKKINLKKNNNET
jgi:hypothetical protein